MLFLNIFGGRDRIIYPRFFSSFIILPDELINYEYTNEYTGERYRIDWQGAGARTELVRSTARDELVLPCNIKPQIALTGLSDGSQRYGGADRLADWRISATINYEVEIPNYFILQSDYLALGMDVEVRYGSAFSAYNDYQPPQDRWLHNVTWDLGLDATSDSRVTVDPCDATNEVVYEESFEFKYREFYEVKQTDIDSTSNLRITLHEQNLDNKVVIVNSKEGQLNYQDHYYIDSGNIIVIRTTDTVNLQAGWMLEVYIYGP
jgi:hypothetical protein